MDTRIIDHPAFALIGHAVRVPLIHEGENRTSANSSSRSRPPSMNGSRRSRTRPRQGCCRSRTVWIRTTVKELTSPTSTGSRSQRPPRRRQTSTSSMSRQACGPSSLHTAPIRRRCRTRGRPQPANGSHRTPGVCGRGPSIVSILDRARTSALRRPSSGCLWSGTDSAPAPTGRRRHRNAIRLPR